MLTREAARADHTETIVDLDPLLAEVAEVRRKGWARQREEIHEGISGFAAPVLDAAGKLLAALVVMGPTARIEEHAESIVEILRRGAGPERRGRGALDARVDADDRPSVSRPPRRRSAPPPSRSLGSIAARVLLPALTFVVLIGLWWLATIVFDWPSYIVPTPLEVWNEMVDQRSFLMSNFRTTLGEALLGFGLAIALAMPSPSRSPTRGCSSSRSTRARRAQRDPEDRDRAVAGDLDGLRRRRRRS